MLEDLLEHEVRIAALLYLSQVDIDSLHLQFLFLAQNAHHLEFLVTTDDGDIAIFQIYHLVGILHDRTGVRPQEELILTDTHHQRTLLACSHNLFGVALIEHGNSIGTYHLIQSHLDGGQQIKLLVHLNILYELYQHFRIGIALEMNTFRHQLFLDVGIILDDTVVDDGQVVALRIVRVGITTGGFSMGGPTRMSDANGAAHILVRTKLHEVVDFSFRLVDVQVAISVNQSHASRVVTTIFQSA